MPYLVLMVARLLIDMTAQGYDPQYPYVSCSPPIPGLSSEQGICQGHPPYPRGE